MAEVDRAEAIHLHGRTSEQHHKSRLGVRCETSACVRRCWRRSATNDQRSANHQIWLPFISAHPAEARAADHTLA